MKNVNTKSLKKIKSEKRLHRVTVAMGETLYKWIKEESEKNDHTLSQVVFLQLTQRHCDDIEGSPSAGTLGGSLK